MSIDEKDDQIDDRVSEGFKSDDNIEIVQDYDDVEFTNEDATLFDATINDNATVDNAEKNRSDSHNLDTHIDANETISLGQSRHSGDFTERSLRSEYEDNQENVDKDNLYKLECDPCYLPGDFPTLPDEYDDMTFPITYHENSMKEELCLEFVDNFTRQYCHLYRDRRPLFIKPLNECKLPKMVCTTINPTKLPFPDVYYWEGAATFVADYLTMVPIVPCTNIPKRLLSATTSLSLQRGTCFEYATLLCSLLVGVGYNAYVVSGYATRETCFMDRSRDVCPSLEMSETSIEQLEVRSNKKYMVRPPKDLTSKFEQEREEKKNKIEHDRLIRIADEIKEDERVAEQPRDDPLYGQRVHAWVLVLAGKREIGESFFIEALTGKACSVSDASSRDYLGIESLWNHKNYWVNMQMATAGVASLNYDLNNTSFWEYLFSGQEPVVIGPPVESPPGFDPIESEENTISGVGDRHFDLPKSWTKTIVVSLKEFELRCAEGRNETLYKKARLEKYSPYVHKDGIVTRLRRYEDRTLHRPIEVVEKFENRNDKLIKRVTDPNSGMVSEYFHKGRKSHLAEHHFYSGVGHASNGRTMTFYNEARVDCLSELDSSETKLITRYKKRDDFLVERIVTLGKVKKEFAPANEREYQKPLETIIEHYSRNKTLNAEKDIREVIFLLSEKRILVSFHTADNNIVGDMVEFVKSISNEDSRRGSVIKLSKDACTYFQVDPYRPKLTEVETYQYYLYLLEKEETSQAEIRKIELEIKEILNLRDKEMISNKMEISQFDRVRNTDANKTRIDMERIIEQDKFRVKDEELDYLEPFLLQLDIGKEDEITKEQAVKLYENCLQDFKQRLLQKANLLQSRFEKETEKLQEKQQWYQKKQSEMQKADEQEYLQFCNEVTFRINTLEKMLARHKQRSKFEETQLDERLRSDKRIAKYLNVK